MKSKSKNSRSSLTIKENLSIWISVNLLMSNYHDCLKIMIDIRSKLQIMWWSTRIMAHLRLPNLKGPIPMPNINKFRSKKEISTVKLWVR